MRFWLAGAFALLFCLSVWAQPPVFKVLTIGAHRVRAELASTEKQRQTGLMFRTSMPEQVGMLFVFDLPGKYCFWMKDTRIPLSIAFIDSAGRIVQLADMSPGSEEVHCPNRAVLYALEMNRGWFRKRGIGPGAFVEGIRAR